jgi:hypothetical protein
VPFVPNSGERGVRAQLREEDATESDIDSDDESDTNESE